MRIAVLGAGLVGGPMAADLAREPDFRVTAHDLDPAALDRLEGVDTERTDLADPDRVRDIAAGSDLVLSAVPGSMGFATLRAVLEAGTDAVDIAFFPEDPFDLDDLARARGVRAVVDCGVAPGTSNLLVGHAASRLDRVEAVRIRVGGLPEARHLPWQYRAVFSPVDVLEEYVRPARVVRGGRERALPALSEAERVEIDGVGTLEAFLTDGLRSLARTIDAPEMWEKTLRYPGTLERLRLLRDAGFLGREPVDVGGAEVRPLDLAAALLIPAWELAPGEPDLTAMRVEVDGRRAGERVRLRWDLLDRLDPDTGVHSMARTTGYMATMTARAVARGMVPETGILPPELLGGEPHRVRFLLDGLAERGVCYREREEPLAS